MYPLYKHRIGIMESHGFVAMVSHVLSAEPAEACPPSRGFGGHPLHMPPRLGSRGFLRRRVKGAGS